MNWHCNAIFCFCGKGLRELDDEGGGSEIPMGKSLQQPAQLLTRCFYFTTVFISTYTIVYFITHK